jgi:hypothetical protein
VAKVNIICLTPVKNESWILDRFLKCASLWADHIIVADQMSDDNSRDIASSYPKVTLIDNQSPTYNELHRQRMLLEAARRLRGPRLLLALDADEVLTSNFLTSVEWRTVLQAPPGSVIYLKWANLLPGAQSYWSSGYDIPFGFMDDGSDHEGAKIHSMRVPIPSGSSEIRLQEIKVLHYQYTNWERMESKHRWYQCWERRNNPELHCIDLYREYHHMYAIRRTDIHPLPTEWVSGYERFNIDMMSLGHEQEYWWDREVLKLIAENGPRTFRKEAIWDIDWPEQNRKLNNAVMNFEFRDPRRWSDKLVQWWLRKTQSIHHKCSVKSVDRLLKSIYR